MCTRYIKATTHADTYMSWIFHSPAVALMMSDAHADLISWRYRFLVGVRPGVVYATDFFLALICSLAHACISKYKHIPLSRVRPGSVDASAHIRLVFRYSCADAFYVYICIYIVFLTSPILSSLARRRFYPRWSSGQAVYTVVVVPSPPRYVPIFFIAYRVQHSHCSPMFIECSYLTLSCFPLIMTIFRLEKVSASMLSVIL